VPGTWVRAPQVGFLRTPAYWGFVDGVYVFHAGYWGPHIAKIFLVGGRGNQCIAMSSDLIRDR
jgi:hypothetical protein